MKKDGTEKFIGDAERDNIRRILDSKIETDEDYAELAKLVEDETDENDMDVDRVDDAGVGG